jgi:hypothetical protein
MEKEIITDVDLDYKDSGNGDRWIGIKIKTTHQEIILLIDDHHRCCEDYGYYIKPETDLIGAELKTIGWGRDQYSENEAVIDIETDRGVVQAVLYNHHNGYYPHHLWVRWKDYEDMDMI